MRRRLLVAAASTAALAAGCGGGGSSTAGPAGTPPGHVSPAVASASPTPVGAAGELVGKDAAAVVVWLKTHGVQVTVTKVYDENTDPNSLLGRPGGYTSKAAFQDARVPADRYGSEPDDPDRGGSVEVFGTEDRAVARAKDVQVKLKAFGLGTEYDYIVGGVLVRVTGTVSPTQARSYQDALGVPPQPAA